jgi:hypothetical protein
MNSFDLRRNISSSYQSNPLHPILSLAKIHFNIIHPPTWYDIATVNLCRFIMSTAHDALDASVVDAAAVF